DDAASRAAAHAQWLSSYDADRAVQAERLTMAREQAALLEPCRDGARVAGERVAAATRRDTLATRRAAQHDVVTVLVDRAQDARDRLFDLREQRINGMAGELAETLVAGAPCPVCGSDAH